MEKEAVEVHGVRLALQVDDAPVLGRAQRGVQALGVGPGLAVDDMHKLQIRMQAAIVVPALNHKNAVGEHGARRIYDEGSAHPSTRMLVGNFVECGPVSVCAWLAGVESELPGFIRRDLDKIGGVAGMLLQAA